MISVFFWLQNAFEPQAHTEPHCHRHQRKTRIRFKAAWLTCSSHREEARVALKSATLTPREHLAEGDLQEAEASLWLLCGGAAWGRIRGAAQVSSLIRG